MCSIVGCGLLQDYAHSVSVQKPAAQKTEEGTTRWSGKVKHRLGDSTVELFYLSALVPADVAEQMPTTLFVTELAPVRPRPEAVNCQWRSALRFSSGL